MQGQNAIKAISLDEFKKKNMTYIFKAGKKQILLKGYQEDNSNSEKPKVFAIDNRCPHEGYPLSVGDVNEKNCTLTCNFHNWKFKLDTGECIIGQDHVRSYKTTIKNDFIWVDTSEPTREDKFKSLLNSFNQAKDDRQYARMARELTRMEFEELDLTLVLKDQILKSFELFEYGQTHAYAASADWLYLYIQAKNAPISEQRKEEKILSILEATYHIAWDIYGKDRYSFTEKSKTFISDDFLQAIEDENEELALSFINGAFEEGLNFKDLEPFFTFASLKHFNDFGHSLIYTQKSAYLSNYFNDINIDKALALSLCRSIVYATREDLLPEYKKFAPTLTILNKLKYGTDTISISQNLTPSFKRISDTFAELTKLKKQYTYESLYDFFLYLNAKNFFYYDMSFQFNTDNPVKENTSWLSFTHAITFPNALRNQLARLEKSNTSLHLEEIKDLGLLQCAMLYGMNTPFVNFKQDLTEFTKKIDLENKQAYQSGREDFFGQTLEKIKDHGQSLPIFSAHVLKTSLANFEEMDHVHSKKGQSELINMLASSINRFVNSQIKQKHVLRTVKQSIDLVRKDF